MGSILCIPGHLTEKLKQAAVKGEIDIAKMYEMSSEERRNLFEKYVDKDMSKFINTEFEKAMISTQVTALKDWAEKVFNPKEKKTARYKDVLAKIDDLNSKNLLTPEGEKSFLADLVADKLGASVTTEEAANIAEKAKKLEELAAGRSDYNTPTMEYFEAKKEMEDYLASLVPHSELRVATSTIGRATMLLSFKSPLLNIESNTIQGFLQAAERRFNNLSAGGINGEYASKYMKFVNDVFAKTGYDVTRMESLSSNRKQLGEEVTNTQGKGAVRKIGRIYEDIVFKRLLSAPDVAFSSFHFADSANIMSTKIAKALGLSGDQFKAKSLEIFKDATSIEPQTKEGQLVRAQAMADAQYATYTNKSVYSDIALGIRKLFNLPSGDLRVGDQLMPFVKTPANVIGAGIESSGILVPVDVVMRMANTIKAIHAGETIGVASKENFRGFARVAIRAGLGATFAFLLTSLFKPEDFIGEYPVSAKERELLELKNATTNSVKIGNKWISLDYFGPLAAPLVGMLYAKKYGGSLSGKAVAYYKGVLLQSTKIPGFTEFYSFVKGIQEATPRKKENPQETLNKALNFSTDFLRARIIPGIAYDLARATDSVDREVDYTKPLDKIKSTIPGLRETLPEKYNIFGETIEGEGWITMLTGSRMKTSQTDDKIVAELVRLDESGFLPAITDVSKTSPRAKELKSQIGDEKFTEAMRTFGQWFKDELNSTMDSYDYQDATDEEKKGMVDSLKSELFNDILFDYGYEPPEKD